ENDPGRYGKRSQGLRAQDQRGVGRSQHRSRAEDSGTSPTSGREAARARRGGDEAERGRRRSTIGCRGGPPQTARRHGRRRAQGATGTVGCM
ncbi:unnamed protein product, partial [Ectocarpus sp. 12 AP-2014]